MMKQIMIGTIVGLLLALFLPLVTQSRTSPGLALLIPAFISWVPYLPSPYCCLLFKKVFLMLPL